MAAIQQDPLRMPDNWPLLTRIPFSPLYHHAVPKHSFGEQIRRYPIFRIPEKKNDKPFRDSKTINTIAFLLAATGQVARKPCDLCIDNAGQWCDCVIPIAQEHLNKIPFACANCTYQGSMTRCSLHFQYLKELKEMCEITDELPPVSDEQLDEEPREPTVAEHRRNRVMSLMPDKFRNRIMAFNYVTAFSDGRWGSVQGLRDFQASENWDAIVRTDEDKEMRDIAFEMALATREGEEVEDVAMEI